MQTGFPTLQEAHIWAQPVAICFSVIIKGPVLHFIQATEGPVFIIQGTFSKVHLTSNHSVVKLIHTPASCPLCSINQCNHCVLHGIFLI